MDWDDFSEESGPEIDYDGRLVYDPWVEAGGGDASRLGPCDIDEA